MQRAAETQLSVNLIRAKSPRSGRAELVELQRAIDAAKAARVSGELTREAEELLLAQRTMPAAKRDWRWAASTPREDVEAQPAGPLETPVDVVRKLFGSVLASKGGGAALDPAERAAQEAKLSQALVRARSGRGGRAELELLERAVKTAAGVGLGVENDAVRDARALLAQNKYGGNAELTDAQKAAVGRTAKTVVAQQARADQEAAREAVVAKAAATAKETIEPAVPTPPESPLNVACRQLSEASETLFQQLFSRPGVLDAAWSAEAEADAQRRTAELAAERGRLLQALVRARSSRAGRAELDGLEAALESAVAAGLDGDSDALREARNFFAGKRDGGDGRVAAVEGRVAAVKQAK